MGVADVMAHFGAEAKDGTGVFRFKGCGNFTVHALQVEGEDAEVAEYVANGNVRRFRRQRETDVTQAKGGEFNVVLIIYRPDVLYPEIPVSTELQLDFLAGSTGHEYAAIAVKSKFGFGLDDGVDRPDDGFVHVARSGGYVQPDRASGPGDAVRRSEC